MLDVVKLRETLQDCGIIVHHVTTEVMGTVVVYLHGPACQWYEAQEIARAFPGVVTVTFSDESRSLMFVSC